MTAVLRELWAFRDLAIVLSWRELVVRYKRSVVGIWWALAEPLMLVAVYVVVFGYVLGAREGVSNYILFALMGVLPWTFFQSTLDNTTTVLLEHSPIMKKAYFPWELLVFSVVLSRVSTLLLGLVLGVVSAAVLGDGEQLAWGRAYLLVPGVVGLTMLAASISALTAPLQVLLRDVHFMVRFALRIGFFLCPVAYPATRVPEAARALYDLNPLVALLWCFQAFTDRGLPAPSDVAIASSLGAVTVSAAFGWWAFRRLRWRVADLL